MEISHVNWQQYQERLEARKGLFQNNYLAMYSSWLDGIVTDPAMMSVPVDDHIVHRGDAVFEAFKRRNGKTYLLQAHLDRLEKSSSAIDLKWPMDRDKLLRVIDALANTCGEQDLLFRLYLSRGPGGFSTNPYESVGSQVYIVATKWAPVPEEKYEQGVSIAESAIPMKPSWLATVKSCNYLPNVMMKKEAIDQGVDYTVSFTEEGWLGEGSTENIALLTQDNQLLYPDFEQTLRGTTLVRLVELADSLVQEGFLKKVGEHRLSKKALLEAKEVFMVGTTLDVLPVVKFSGQSIGGGQVGPVAKKCRQLLLNDQQ